MVLVGHVAGGEGLGDATRDMIAQDLPVALVERGAPSGNLGQAVHATAALVHTNGSVDRRLASTAPSRHVWVSHAYPGCALDTLPWRGI